MTAVADQRYHRSSNALSATVADDFVALHLDRGTCFGMADVTADVWSLLEEPRTLAEIVGRLTSDYDVSDEQCRAEVTDLVELMVQEGLVDISQ